MGKCAHVWEQMPGIPEVASPGTIVVDSLTMGLAHFFFQLCWEYLQVFSMKQLWNTLAITFIDHRTVYATN